ncbi:bifunctional DNA primase/polymerase [Streptomyces sp. NPDC059452]|uniref:bifunctional DNA primase/polymerase n=1 Tax=Streptomyces sp. NPDC059452 TaxID=3346835 RepID=UPI00369D4A56
MTTYARSGWDGIIPIRPGTKEPAVGGITGRYAQLTAEECVQIAHLYTQCNLALRLPRGIIGIDVDAYDGRGGDRTMRRLQMQHGQLPPTFYTTSRGPGASGIRLYRTRGQQRLKQAVGPGVEIVQHHHRFAVAWPSLHPKSGEQYEWYFGSSPERLDLPPMPRDLPFLPPRVELALRAPERAPVPAPTDPLPIRLGAVPGLLRALRAAADSLAALPVGSEADTPCNNAALEFSKYAPHDTTADEIRQILGSGVDKWVQGRDRGHAAINRGLSVIGTARHRPQAWIDKDGAGFALIKEAGNQ